MNNFKSILIGILLAVIVIGIGASAYTALASPSVANAASVNEFQAGPGTAAAVGSAVYGGNGKGGNGNGGSWNGGNGSGLGEGDLQLAAISPSDLSAEEAAGLYFMHEEEKLARDVYSQMYTLWGQPVFQNIASSEQNHMDQVKLLMDRYGLVDSAREPGEFTDASLQALYDQLIAQGSVSLEEALQVGVLIEQTDIADLQARLAQTDNADIQLVYNNLLSASYNHLSAFTGGGQRGGNGRGRGGGAGNGRQ